MNRLTAAFDSVCYKGYYILLEISGCWIYNEEENCYIDGPFTSIGQAMFKIDQYLE